MIRLRIVLFFSIVVTIGISATGQTFSTIFVFDQADGLNPQGALAQGIDGNLYGTTIYGGTSGCTGGQPACGNFYRITPGGLQNSLYSFCLQQPYCSVDGAYPNAGVVLGTSGYFYGTTYGQDLSYGTVYKISSKGLLTTLYTFCQLLNCADGLYPVAPLTQGSDGNFYGTTISGGTSPYSSDCYNGCGTGYKITPAGTFSSIYSFCSLPNCLDGDAPTQLIQASDGNFYGTTDLGGTSNDGTIFKLTSKGKLTTIYNFCSQSNCSDGAGALSGVIQGADGNLYGTTYGGGVYNSGTIFKISPTGKFTTLYSFCSQSNCADGSLPTSPLMQATDGNFYGTTSYGGLYDCGLSQDNYPCGTLFRITPSGIFTVIHSFDGFMGDGGSPNQAGLFQSTNGVIYGTTFYWVPLDCDGGLGCGAVFSLDIGASPFIRTLPGQGKVGSEVGILGNGLTSATSVTFKGTKAQFTVRSATLILTHVPAGATTGVVEVTLPSGTLTSNVPFQVIP